MMNKKDQLEKEYFMLLLRDPETGEDVERFVRDDSGKKEILELYARYQNDYECDIIYIVNYEHLSKEDLKKLVDIEAAFDYFREMLLNPTHDETMYSLRKSKDLRSLIFRMEGRAKRAEKFGVNNDAANDYLSLAGYRINYIFVKSEEKFSGSEPEAKRLEEERKEIVEREKRELLRDLESAKRCKENASFGVDKKYHSTWLGRVLARSLKRFKKEPVDAEWYKETKMLELLLEKPDYVYKKGLKELAKLRKKELELVEIK